jgi:hypothetical protein
VNHLFSPKVSTIPLFAACLIATFILRPAAAAARPTISLAGEWQFDLPGASGTSTLPDKLSQTIRLPGTMDDAGIGPKNEKQPTLEGPYRKYNYAGPAWYRREVDIPKSWKGKRVTLFLERCRWETTVWLDDKCVGTENSLIAPHVFNLGTEIRAGKHQLTICVDNTLKINVGGIASVLFGGIPGNMNGVVGRIELAAMPPVWIDDMQVYPDVDKMTAWVVVKIGNATGKAGHALLSVGGKTIKASWGAAGGQVETEVDMTGAKLWDEFSPNLTEVTATLGDDQRTVRFGMRKFVARGTQFTMNGRPVFLRGTLECSVFPLTGYPPTDVASWQRIFRIIKSYGLNFMRFHSWCPPEAAFEAADIEGVMIQAEGPIANIRAAGDDPTRDGFAEEEFKRMVDTYGNHPSFCTMTIGNEYGGNAELLARWVDMLIQRDPRHLYASASEGQKTPNRQWTETTAGRGVHDPGTERDLREAVSGDWRPNVGHEIGQWVYYPNFDEIKKYTGALELRNFELIRDDLEKKHQLDLVPKYIEACGKLATLLYKEEIELLLRTQGYAGFSLLDLHDYPMQGTALIGPLDEFWDSKGFVTPEEFRQYCGPTVPLLRMPKRTYTESEAFEATVQVAHYGPADLANAIPIWNIRDPQGTVVASGTLAASQLPTGKLSDIGAIRTPLTGFHTPGKFSVTVSLQGTEFSNSWEIWVYPDQPKPISAPDRVIVSSVWDDATKQALVDGKAVFLTMTKLKSANSVPGSLLTVFWSPVWFPSQSPNTMSLLCDPGHPALSEFPTEMHGNWQWWNILKHSKALVLDDAPAGFHPIIQVIDNYARNHLLGNLFEARVGKGRLLFCSIDLTAEPDHEPAARQLLASLYAYLGSDRFHPKSELSPQLLDRLLSPPVNNLMALGAKVIAADSEAPGYPASNAIDGDESTFWHTRWQPAPDPLPHSIVVDMGRDVSIKGVTVLPRQDGVTQGRIANCEIYCENDPKTWGTPAVVATLRNTSYSQRILFQKPVSGRYLKLKIISAGRECAFCSLAELDIVPE